MKVYEDKLNKQESIINKSTFSKKEDGSELDKKDPQPPKKEGLEEATEKPVEPNQELLW